MPAKGIAVSAPRGAYYMLDSGDPKKDREDAEALEVRLGKEAIVRPLGGADAYVSNPEVPEDATSDVQPYR